MTTTVALLMLKISGKPRCSVKDRNPNSFGRCFSTNKLCSVQVTHKTACDEDSKYLRFPPATLKACRCGATSLNNLDQYNTSTHNKCNACHVGCIRDQVLLTRTESKMEFQRSKQEHAQAPSSRLATCSTSVSTPLRESACHTIHRAM